MALVIAAMSCSFYVACGDDDVIFEPSVGGTGGRAGAGGSGGATAGTGGATAGTGGATAGTGGATAGTGGSDADAGVDGGTDDGGTTAD